MEGRDEPRNLDNFAVVSCRISRPGPRNMAKIFRGKLWALVIRHWKLFDIKLFYTVHKHDESMDIPTNLLLHILWVALWWQWRLTRHRRSI